MPSDKQLKFFCDNCLSPRYAQVLKDLGVSIVHLQERFGAGIKDIDWIPPIATEGLIIITSDDNMRRAKLEAAALRDNDAIAFFLSHSFPNQGLWRQAELLCKYWPNIVKVAETAKPKDMFDVSLGGKIATKRL